MSVSEHLDFRLLKYIVAVAEEGTFTAAAARLHLSQSALSTQIKGLEDNLGIKIFDRDRGTTLTAEGKVLLRYGREGLRTRDHIVETIQAIHAGRIRPFRLAFTPFVLNSLLKIVSDLYRDLIPDSDIIPESDSTDETIAWLRDGECDAALVTLPIDANQLDVTILERQRLLVCMRNDDPLAVEEEIPISALNGKISIFTYQKHHPLAHQQLTEMFAEFGVTPRPCKPTMNMDHIQWMVKEGRCYSLVRADQPLTHGLTARPIAEADCMIETAIVRGADHKNPALALLVEELRKRCHINPPPAAKRTLIPIGAGNDTKIRKTAVRDAQITLFNNRAAR